MGTKPGRIGRTIIQQNFKSAIICFPQFTIEQSISGLLELFNHSQAFLATRADAKLSHVVQLSKCGIVNDLSIGFPKLESQ